MNYVLREAGNLLKKHGTANPNELARCLDIEILILPMQKINGFFINMEGNKFAVINENISFSRQQFTLLHEIAHAHLHPEDNYFIINENPLRTIRLGKDEQQADIFAAALFLRETPEEYRGYVAGQLATKVPETYIRAMLK